MTLRDIDIYLKRKALAESRGGDVNESATAQRQVAEMERDYPGIRETAERVQRAAEGTTEATPPSKWTGFFRNLAESAATHYADRTADEVTGARRFEPLAKGQCVLREHTCAPGQICLEIRVLSKDLRSTKVRARILEGIEEELITLADK